MKKIEKIALYSLLGFVVVLFPVWLILFSLATQTHTISMPDTAFLYSNSYLESLRTFYGETGIASYVWTHLTFDLAFPILYGFFLVVFIRKYAIKRPLLVIGTIFALLAVFFDWFENITVILYLTTIFQYWHPFTWIFSPITFLTMAKWLCLFAAIIILIVSIIQKRKAVSHA